MNHRVTACMGALGLLALATLTACSVRVADTSSRGTLSIAANEVRISVPGAPKAYARSWSKKPSSPPSSPAAGRLAGEPAAGVVARGAPGECPGFAAGRWLVLQVATAGGATVGPVPLIADIGSPPLEVPPLPPVAAGATRTYRLPVSFRLTSDTVMTSFFIPQLGSQIYAMAGRQSRLHLLADHAGVYRGQNQQFSGRGFADMHFQVRVLPRSQFAAWAKRAGKGRPRLDPSRFRRLSRPSTREHVAYYAPVSPGLFREIIDGFRHGRGPLAAARAGR